MTTALVCVINNEIERLFRCQCNIYVCVNIYMYVFMCWCVRFWWIINFAESENAPQQQQKQLLHYYKCSHICFAYLNEIICNNVAHTPRLPLTNWKCLLWHMPRLHEQLATYLYNRSNCILHEICAYVCMFS